MFCLVKKLEKKDPLSSQELAKKITVNIVCFDYPVNAYSFSLCSLVMKFDLLPLKNKYPRYLRHDETMVETHLPGT